MKEVFEKIKERLEEASWNTMSTFDEDGYSNDDSEEVITLDIAIEIVNQVESEYNNGWIPCSEKPPKETGMYQVTVDDADEPIITAMYLQEVDIWCFHHGYDTGMTVLAWRPLPEPYKGEQA